LGQDGFADFVEFFFQFRVHARYDRTTHMTSASTTDITPREHIHFVTGRLAEHAVRAIVEQVASAVGFSYSIDVLPITVAALMTPKWLLRHIVVPPNATRVIVPGYMKEGTAEVAQQLNLRVDSGPRDIRDLPDFFGKKRQFDQSLNDYRIEIIAEINHAPRMAIDDLIQIAQQLRNDGADVIDIGCDPGYRWTQVGEVVRRLRELGLRVSIDSFDINEVSDACAAGSELVLSVNSNNMHAAVDWGREVVVIPDTPGDKKNFQKTIDFLSTRSVPIRIDPILEPIGCGFAQSLNRYIACREQYPDAAMMMGIGNITELTDADSGAINVVLLGFCEELQINSVLTTQVINWSRTSVRECDLARRLVHYAVRNRIPPKHIQSQLVVLRDELAQTIRDHNLRIFAQDDLIHLVSTGLNLSGSDPFEVMQQLLASHLGPTIDASHAFYLGFELSKAATALTLAKQYEQDEALDWGFLTRHEKHQRLPRGRQ
jgi:dihydropteroate synthase